MGPLTKNVTVNAYIIDAWIQAIRDAGGRPFIVVYPELAARPLQGLPPHYLNRVLASRHRKFRLCLDAPTKIVKLDKAEGFLHLEAHLDGMSCPTLCIPVECVSDVYTPDIADLGAFASCLPVMTNLHYVRCEDGRVKKRPCGQPIDFHDGLLRDVVMGPSAITREDTGPEANRNPDRSPPRRGHLVVVK